MGGAGRLCGIGISGCGLLTLLTPMLAHYGTIPLVIARGLIGVFQGVMFPSALDFWSHWAPPMESTRLISITTSGCNIGTFVTMAFSGVVAQYLNWRWIFYFSGSSALLWSVLWLSFVSDDPSKDKRIPREELEYIIGATREIKKTKIADTPWRQALSSIPFWTCVVAQTMKLTVLFTINNELPKYLNDVSGMKLDKNGVLSGIPYLGMAICSQAHGFLSDRLRTKYKMKTTHVRKIFICGSLILQAGFLVLTAFLDSFTASVVFISLTVAAQGLSAVNVNLFDLAPQYAGMMMGFANTFATLPGMISPVITGYIVQNHLRSEWRIVFYLTASSAVFGAIVFAIFSSGDLQPWAKSNEDKDSQLRVKMLTVNESSEK